MEVGHSRRTPWRAGWVTFVDITTGDATTPTQLPTEEVPWSPGTWRPDGEQYLGWRTNGVATVLDTSTGDVVGDTEPFGGIYSAAYVDGDGRLLAGDVAGRTHLLDADSLLAEGAGYEFAAEFVNPIGDGSTAMVGARSADGTVVQWRVIDVRSGEVLSEGDVGLVRYTSAASPDGSTVAMAVRPARS